MSEVVYTSEVRIERQRGPLRLAYMPAEKEPVPFGVHGAIAAHYGVSCIPRVFLFHDGQIVARHGGFSDADEAQNWLESRIR